MGRGFSLILADENIGNPEKSACVRVHLRPIETVGPKYQVASDLTTLLTNTQTLIFAQSKSQPSPFSISCNPLRQSPAIWSPQRSDNLHWQANAWLAHTQPVQIS